MRALLVAVVLLLLLSGCTDPTKNLMSEELYVHSCATCHGLEGEGGIGVEIASGSNTAENLSDEQIAGVITVGPGNMPGFSRLTPEQVDSLVRYVRSLSK